MGRHKMAPLNERLAASERLIQHLKTLRKSQNLTQLEVARRLGVHRSYVSQLESKKVAISHRHLRGLAAIYDVPPQELFAEIGLQEFDWVGTLRAELTEYLTFIRWHRSRTVLSTP